MEFPRLDLLRIVDQDAIEREPIERMGRPLAWVNVVRSIGPGVWRQSAGTIGHIGSDLLEPAGIILVRLMMATAE